MCEANNHGWRSIPRMQRPIKSHYCTIIIVHYCEQSTKTHAIKRLPQPLIGRFAHFKKDHLCFNIPLPSCNGVMIFICRGDSDSLCMWSIVTFLILVVFRWSNISFLQTLNAFVALLNRALAWGHTCPYIL